MFLLDPTNSVLSTGNTASKVIDAHNITTEEAGVADNEKLTWGNSISVLKRTGLLMSNLASVYYLEYLITTGLTVAIGG